MNHTKLRPPAKNMRVKVHAAPYGVLTSITTTDEDGRSVTVYSNIHENTVLERRGADNDTYYVYDTYGRLCYVLPPMCQQCSTAMMPKYWYKYTYDDRGRCTEKQLPGCAAVKYWYDSADRIQSEQDGCLRERSQYRNYSYDATGRLILQTVSTTRGEAAQNNAVAVEVKNYYDGYAFRSELGQLFPEWADSINAILPTVEARNKLTATMRGTSNGSRYCEIYRYDMNGRVMYTLSAYGDKWMKTAHTAYNFAGDVTGMEERVYTGNSNISLLAGRRIYNSYYPSTRLLKKTTVSNIDRNGIVTGQDINKPTYDVLGNITGNDRPGTAADMTYSYDILRGWLKGISSPSGFSEQLQRETADNAQYAGNIGSMQWRNAVNGELHKYDYTYDGLGRLTDSQYSSSVNGTDGRFDESLTYNRNGSITSLLRSGMRNDGTFGVIDDLSVNYDGNRLLNVTDDAESLNYNGALDFNDGADMTAEYEYDTTGALTKDRNRGITGITYDLGHNPQTIVMNGGQIVNDYTSDGRKLCSTQSTGMTTTTDMYVDGLIIRNGAPLMWQFNGGYVALGTNSVPQSWNYYITDHLGSTRMVVDSQNNIKETINYYPFGSEMTMTPPAQLTSNPNWQPYRFTGKELVRQSGLNMYDFGARWYDVAGVPVWTSMDPLCEKNYDFSPYVYCKDNPVNAIDPDGKDGIFIAFPDYKISTPIGKIGGLGHAGVLLINNKTGFTKYYEYGRYDSENRGVVRSFSVPNVDIDKNGKPTTKSLNTVMKAVSEKAGHGGRIEGAYVKSDNFDAMNDYASDKLKENSDSNRKAYSLLNNNCGTFAADVLTADDDVEKKAPSIIDPRPNSIVKEFQKEFDTINYNPTKTNQ